MLYPAGLLVMIVLAAIAADMSHVHMARASLNDLAATIANDVSTKTLDETALRDSGSYVLQGETARQAIAQRRIATTATSTLEGVFCTFVEPPGNGTLTLSVTCIGRVAYIFGRAIPGTPDFMDLTATSDVTLVNERCPAQTSC
jgi:hypothetical protein